jgi:hypothetical protein
MKWPSFVLLSTLFACSALIIGNKMPVFSMPAVSSFPNRAWTDHAFNRVQASSLVDLKPNDSHAFCRNGMNAHNWVNLLAAVAKFESNFDPVLEYEEKFTDRTGNAIVSTGLFQLSLESARGYGCDFKTSEDLKDPYKSIDCAVVIMERWVERDNCISCRSNGLWRGGARYWAVLRTKLFEITKFMEPYCG